MKGLSSALVACAVGWAAHGSAVQAQTETVVYSFCSQQNCTDGANPDGGVIDVGGTLYGTASNGGAYTYYGTVFSLDRMTGAESVLHSFQNNGLDGEQPQTGLLRVKGMLYGTSIWGRAYSGGTVFSVNPKTGGEAVVYSFCSRQDCTDGYQPVAGLLDVKGTLYGTTYAGGTGSCPGSTGCGTVFSLDPTSGVETVVYSFQNNGKDGEFPLSGLIHHKHMLYGTTYIGGAHGVGTVFSLNLKSGTETVLHSFCSQQNCTDGSVPTSSLIDVNGTLYGTTEVGGAGTCSGGCGTVFSLDPADNAETVLYSFQNNGADGNRPEAGLVDVDGTLYGTTSAGGAYTYYGTVFSITP